MRYTTDQLHPDLPSTFARKSGRRVIISVPRNRRDNLRKELNAHVDHWGDLWIGIGKAQRVMHIIARVYHEMEADKKATADYDAAKERFMGRIRPLVEKATDLGYRVHVDWDKKASGTHAELNIDDKTIGITSWFDADPEDIAGDLARVIENIEAEKADDPQSRIIKTVIDFAASVEADGTEADPRHPDGGFMFAVRKRKETDSYLRVRVDLGNSTVFLSRGAMFSGSERAYRVRITDEQRHELIRLKCEIASIGHSVSGEVGGVRQRLYLTS